MRSELLFVFVAQYMLALDKIPNVLVTWGPRCIYLASIVHLFYLFYSKINESLYSTAAILYTTRLSSSLEKQRCKRVCEPSHGKCIRMRYLKDYLFNMKLKIITVRMALSEGVTAIPAVEHPCTCRCALYVGQEESRVLANTNSTSRHGLTFKGSLCCNHTSELIYQAAGNK